MPPSFWQDIVTNIEDIVGESVGHYNDASTRQRLLHTISGFLNTLVEHRAVYDYHVICDETNNPPSRVDDHSLVVDVLFIPVIIDTDPCIQRLIDSDDDTPAPIDYLAITRDVAYAKLNIESSE